MADFDERALLAIPAEVHMISGSHDTQTSADVYNVDQFQLPDPAGRSGGACTSALLKVLYADHKMPAHDLTWTMVLRKMRSILENQGFDQVPQLTSSRLIDVNKTMYVVPPGATGTKRAVLIGINYVGQQGELSGCHNDTDNIAEYLEKVHGFQASDMLRLKDDDKSHAPTKQNIFNAFERVTQYSQPGDVVFLHYSGHGGRIIDDDGDEEDGYDETLIPIDFASKGQIRDDDILDTLVRPLSKGVTMTCLMDCCHSGTVLDLPYQFSADSDTMQRNENINFGKLVGHAEGAVAAGCCFMGCLGFFMS